MALTKKMARSVVSKQTYVLKGRSAFNKLSNEAKNFIKNQQQKKVKKQKNYYPNLALANNDDNNG